MQDNHLPNGNQRRPQISGMTQALVDAQDPMATANGPGAPRRGIPDHAFESVWKTPDGFSIRRIDWAGRQGAGHAGEQGRRGSLLFLPGRADYHEKYGEALDDWHRQGWRVTALDWRWQAGSGRYYPDPRIGGVDDFSTWINDLHAFWASWAVAGPGPHVLVGHSMGGHLALRAVADGQVRPDALILSAPMLGFVTPIPTWLQGAFGRLMCRIGDPARPAWSGGERPGDSAKTRRIALTHDPDRYADELWWRGQRPELDMGPASWEWVQRASESINHLARPGLLESVAVPVLMLAARYDLLVASSAIRRAAARLPDVELVEFGHEAAHELLREADPVRDRVLAAIRIFLARFAPTAETMPA
jgi:lysophospholipase